MTPTDWWILGLVLVYAVPSFISGIGVTLLAVRWRDIGRAAAMTPRFLSPELTFERRDLITTNIRRRMKFISLSSNPRQGRKLNHRVRGAPDVRFNQASIPCYDAVGISMGMI